MIRPPNREHAAVAKVARTAPAQPQRVDLALVDIVLEQALRERAVRGIRVARVLRPAVIIIPLPGPELSNSLRHEQQRPLISGTGRSGRHFR